MDQLHDACKRGDLQEVESLLCNKEVDINGCNTDGECPLHIACKYGNLEIVKLLLNNQNCVFNIKNCYGDTPLHFACVRRSLNIVRVLLRKRCFTNIPNKKGETAQNIPLNEDGDRLLHIACKWGDVDIVNYLITDERCDPNLRSFNSGNTPLHIACHGKSLEIIRFLLKNRCRTNIFNKNVEMAQNIPLNKDGASPYLAVLL